jgi:hypothetical protein
VPEADPRLVRRARGRTPADPALHRSWDSVVFGISAGWLTADGVRHLIDELRAGRDVHIRQLAFEHRADGELHATVLGGGGSSPPAALRAELARLVAEPPDAAMLAATPIAWADAGDPELPYRARLDGQNLLIRVPDTAPPRYTLIVDGSPIMEFTDWPPAWQRPSGRPVGAVGPVGPVGAARLLVWSERLCRVGPGEPADIFAALGIAGSVHTDSWGHRTVQPPPAGADRVELGWDGGRAESVQVTFAAPGPARAEFDVYFGHGQWLPRVHWDRPHVLAYQVEVDGAPSGCTVHPSFADEPGETTPAGSAALRRNRP